MSNVIKLDTSVNKESKITTLDQFTGNVGRVFPAHAFGKRLAVKNWLEEFEQQTGEPFIMEITNLDDFLEFGLLDQTIIGTREQFERNLDHLRQFNAEIEKTNSERRERYRMERELDEIDKWIDSLCDEIEAEIWNPQRDL